VKKVRIILTIITLSLIMCITGCSSGKLRTPPWNEDEIKEMDAEYSEGRWACVPLLRYKF